MTQIAITAVDNKNLFSKKNRKKIPVNLSSRQFQTNLRDEFELSLSKLKPLMDRIERTDRLIDQVVYRLYGLTEEEVRVVEESVSGQGEKSSEASRS